MCCCDKPNINGQLGYKWQPNDSPRIRPVDPPAIQDGDVLLWDEPGRCGGIDSHSYHYRIVKSFGTMFLRVRHGGGDERIKLSLYNGQEYAFEGMETHQRYWILNALFHAHKDGGRTAQQKERHLWQQAALDKKIRTRKARGYNSAKVWIEEDQPKITVLDAGTDNLQIKPGGMKL